MALLFGNMERTGKNHGEVKYRSSGIMEYEIDTGTIRALPVAFTPDITP